MAALILVSRKGTANVSFWAQRGQSLNSRGTVELRLGLTSAWIEMDYFAIGGKPFLSAPELEV